MWGGTRLPLPAPGRRRISIHPPRVGWDHSAVAQDLVCGISIHPPRVGWDGRSRTAHRTTSDFNPPTPCGVGPLRRLLSECSMGNFNPPTPCGVGPDALVGCTRDQEFQSTHPVWGGTLYSAIRCSAWEFQSTHPVWGGTSQHLQEARFVVISIHPPRVGWDRRRAIGFGYGHHFNPPTPCGVGLHRNQPAASHKQFQSTHPVWGGTPGQEGKHRLGRYFNPPTPCGVGPRAGHPCRCIHRFQSTHPVWGGTRAAQDYGRRYYISIHPPRVGWDRCAIAESITEDISIHPPRVGWDLQLERNYAGISSFQSTHPVWGGTFLRTGCLACPVISIHPPRVGWDQNGMPSPVRSLAISIHPPRVGWDSTCLPWILLVLAFQSTHPVWGGTSAPWVMVGYVPHFNPPTPCGVGPVGGVRLFCHQDFNPPTPCGVGPGCSMCGFGIHMISIHPPRVGWDAW